MIHYTWDKRKAAANLRKHGVSFTLAESALRSGHVRPIEEQLHNGEWRTLVIGPAAGVVLLTIVIAYDEGAPDEDGDASREGDRRHVETIRIVSARKTEAHEEQLFYEE